MKRTDVRRGRYLRAVFNHAIKTGTWKKANPIAQVSLIKQQERELSFLSQAEIEKLMKELARSSNKNAIKVAKICLATGCRWSEAESLTGGQVHGHVITFARTKSGKIRSVPVDEEIKKILPAKSRNERLFENCYSAFREAIERAEIKLQQGQLTHVLRHTFASHFVQQGGSVVTLQKILGHASLAMTMRYAHLAPEHLEQAKTMNPLSALTIS